LNGREIFSTIAGGVFAGAIVPPMSLHRTPASAIARRRAQQVAFAQ
jgi:hypothetical protein